MRPVMTPESSRRYEMVIRGIALSPAMGTPPSRRFNCLMFNPKRSQSARRAPSSERAPDTPPILDRVLLAGDDLDGDLGVTGLGEAGEGVFDLAFAAGDRRRADERGGHETAFLGLDEHQMAAVIFEVMRALRAELAGGLDIGGDGVGERGRD